MLYVHILTFGHVNSGVNIYLTAKYRYLFKEKAVHKHNVLPKSIFQLIVQLARYDTYSAQSINVLLLITYSDRHA